MGLIKGNMLAVPFCYHRPIVSGSGISFGDQVEIKGTLLPFIVAQISTLLISQPATLMCSWWSPAQVTADSK